MDTNNKFEIYVLTQHFEPYLEQAHSLVALWDST